MTSISLSRNPKLHLVAKQRCRELRQRQTKAESIFWDGVRNRRILGLKFYRQYPLFYDLLGKETFYVADFYCHEKFLVVEIDGAIHKYKKYKDKERTEILNLGGIDVIRFKNEEIENDVDRVLKLLKQRLTQE